MPAPVTYWAPGTPIDAKSLDLALYLANADGAQDTPNGILFHSYRPILFEAYSRTLTLASSTAGTLTSLPGSGATTAGLIVVDSAGYYGMTQDQPFKGYYEFLASVKGSSGDGQTPGGWTLLAHFAAVKPTSTQTGVEADLQGTGQPNLVGTRQMPVTGHDACVFILDLVNVGSAVWSPAVTVADSSSANTSLAVNTTDSSGETCRLCAIWASVSASAAGTATFAIGGTYPWSAPAGVTLVNAGGQGAGGGGGAGNNSTGGVEFGGGGAGAGEYGFQNAIGVTPFSVYTATVGSAGAGGTAPGSAGGTPGPGAAGGNTTFTGDSTSATFHGGSGGTGATGTANGTGGAGGTGSSAFVHHDGGAGANGKTAVYGGGGGSSAGTTLAGLTATTSTGAPAPKGGGPGGNGGQSAISVVQAGHGTVTGTNILTVKMPAQIQAGSTVLVMAYYQCDTLPPGALDPTAVLDDGTVFGTPAVTADMTSLGVPFQNALLNAFNVPGGEQKITITGHGTGNDVKVLMAQVYEVAGLGPSPQVDGSPPNHTQGGSHPDTFYTSNAETTSDAPDLWVAWTGAQQTSSFNIHDPASSLGWTLGTRLSEDNGGIFAVGRGAYQIKSSTGTMLYNGTFSNGVSKGAFACAYASSAATAGVGPVIGPGGGGGAGLGDTNGGGAGSDGQLTLTWAGVSGSAYGTPLLPAPYTSWTDTSTIGAGTDAYTVDINGNTGIADVVNFLSNAPAFRIETTAAQSIANNTLQTVSFPNTSSTTVTLDSYSGWSYGSNEYVVQRDGLYLFHGLISFAASSAGNRRPAVTVNGTSYWGVPGPAPSAGQCNVPVTRIFSLKAGDTVQLACRQNSGGSLGLSTTTQTRMLMVWLGVQGVPASAWNPPDATFRWTSGTGYTSSSTPLLQQHLANDLSFLVQKPYLLAYQATAQTGLTQNAFSTLTRDTVGSPVHTTDSGDSYAGWTSGSSNAYTAQVAGWYLVVGEFFPAAPASGTGTNIAGILASSSGGYLPSQTPDWFQQATVSSGAAYGGATVFGLFYLNIGESITPQVQAAGYSATYATVTGASNGGQVNSHLEAVWISE